MTSFPQLSHQKTNILSRFAGLFIPGFNGEFDQIDSGIKQAGSGDLNLRGGAFNIREKLNNVLHGRTIPPAIQQFKCNYQGSFGL